MNISELVTQLEAVRDVYAQRQRTTTGLITSFQALNKAYGKAQKTLRDYADIPAISTEALNKAIATFAATHLKEEASDPLLPELKREVKSLTHVLGALKDAISALRSNPIDIFKLGKGYQALTNTTDSAVADLLPTLADCLRQAEDDAGTTFGAGLRDAFAAINVTIRGLMPTIEAGRFEIGVHLQARSATLSYGEELLAKHLPLSVESILKAYQAAEKHIMQRQEDSALWIQQFYEAYAAARRPDNNRVNIVDCYFELVMLRQKKGFRAAPSKGAFVEYSRAQFAYDLDRFVNRSQLDYKKLRPALHVATKSTTDNPEKSLWVVEGSGPHDGRYVADVAFEAQNQ